MRKYVFAFLGTQAIFAISMAINEGVLQIAIALLRVTFIGSGCDNLAMFFKLEAQANLCFFVWHAAPRLPEPRGLYFTINEMALRIMAQQI